MSNLSIKKEENCQVQFVVYNGIKSKEIAQLLEKKHKISIFHEEEAFGIDKNKCLYLFDAITKKKKGVMINQSLKNQQDYSYSIAIFRLNRLNSLVDQISSDYFINIERNITRWGFPWGEIRRKDKLRDNLFALTEHNDKAVREFFLTLRRFGVLTIKKDNSDKIIEWINDSKTKEANIFVMVCPDYSFAYDSNDNILRYDTNNTLREGVGLVAIKSLEFLKCLSDLIAKHKLRVKVIIGISDYEDTDDNLFRLKETKSSFYEKIKKSIKNIQTECCKINLNFEVIGIREYFGERLWLSRWEESEKLIKEEIEKIGGEELNKMISNRKKLYLRWLPDISNDSVLKKMISQGTEYTNCGYLFAQKVPNLLILGTNSIDMTSFYKLRANNLPIVYITKIYE